MSGSSLKMGAFDLISIRNYVVTHWVSLDDSNKVVKVVASDGKTGQQRELSYTNCKVIGNGSFGIVFQAKVINAPKGEEDIAIKKVLQDKRFKVILSGFFFNKAAYLTCRLFRWSIESGVANNEASLTS